MASPELTIAVKSADRVLDVFELLADSNRGMTHTEIASELGIPKGSLTKLLKNLEKRGYVSFDSSTRSHTLGPSFARLSQRPALLQGLIDITIPQLQLLTHKTGESSALNRVHGMKSEVIATILSNQRLVSHLRVGDIAPLYAISGGKAVLSRMPEARLQRYLSDVRFEDFTSSTFQSAEQLLKELAEVRRTGVAYSHEEYTPGIIGLGVALELPEEYPGCSLNVAVPALRWNPGLEATAIAALHDAKTAIERGLG